MRLQVRQFIILVLVFLITACSKNSAIENTLIDMNESLARYAGVENSIAIDLVRLEPPEKSTLRVDIDEVSINLREFYSLNQCQLTKLVAVRNTALGKMQLPSVRFSYEHRLLDELSNCERQLDDTHRMKAKVNEWLTIKQENLPRSYANLITQSRETYNAFMLPSGYISDAGSDNFSGSMVAIDAISTSPYSFGFDINNLENHLRILDSARLIANMWNTQNLFVEALPQITRTLKAYQAKNTCATVAQREELKVMENIFEQYFTEEVEPLAHQLNRYQNQISPLLYDLAQMPALPKRFVDYIALHSVDRQQEYRIAMSEHLEEWQNVFALCS